MKIHQKKEEEEIVKLLLNQLTTNNLTVNKKPKRQYETEYEIISSLFYVALFRDLSEESVHCTILHTDGEYFSNSSKIRMRMFRIRVRVRRSYLCVGRRMDQLHQYHTTDVCPRIYSYVLRLHP